VREAAAKNEGENGGKKRHQKSFKNGVKKWRSRRRHIVNIPGVLNTFCCPISNYAIHQQLIEKRRLSSKKEVYFGLISSLMRLS